MSFSFGSPLPVNFPANNGQRVMTNEPGSTVPRNESRHSFDWSIPKFLSHGGVRVSPTYRVGVQEINFSSSWRLVLHPDGDSDEAKDYISLYMEDVTLTDSTSYGLSFQFSILNKRNLRCNIMTSERDYNFIRNGQTFGFSKFIKKIDLIAAASGLLVDEQLRINCVVHFKKVNIIFTSPASPDFKFVSRSKDSSKSYPDKRFKAGSPGGAFSVDIGRVLWQHVVDKKYSDVIIEVGGEEFALHKNVLARSPVFDSMFEHNMKEANEKRVTISDCEPAVFKEFLRYIYTGIAENLDNVAGKLILCADKYCMEGLKRLCESVLIRKLSSDNAAETLQLADLLNLDLLKKETLQFIKSRPVKVVQSDGWQNLPHHLSVEVTLALAKMIQESLIQL